MLIYAPAAHITMIVPFEEHDHTKPDLKSALELALKIGEASTISPVFGKGSPTSPTLVLWYTSQ